MAKRNELINSNRGFAEVKPHLPLSSLPVLDLLEILLKNIRPEELKVMSNILRRSFIGSTNRESLAAGQASPGAVS